MADYEPPRGPEWIDRTLTEGIRQSLDFPILEEPPEQIEYRQMLDDVLSLAQQPNPEPK